MKIKTLTNNSPAISQTQQLTLHAILGCAIGAGMSGGGSGCASGAVAGVVGELTANSMYQEGRTNLDGTPIGFSRNTSIAMGGLSGSLASAFTSIALGDDDSKVAKNIYAGSFVGTNAGANNALQIMAQKVPPLDKSHLTIVHTPEPNEQALYAGKEGYVQDKASGLWIRTWGAGPSMVIAGDLVSDNNRTRDIDLSIKTYQSPNLAPLNFEQFYRKNPVRCSN